ncbi:MAG TPA: FHA domain-containing protein [Gaiellaceae bacterium]|nr:FHA domain-containing protein [Gaiellaceae bacterium]
MTPALVFKEGPLAGRRVDVGEELVIGRADADLTIDDEEVSRRHAVVRPGDGAIEIEDLGSRNGTYVNGVRIDSVTRLAGGDSVKLGKSVLQVDSGRAVAETVAAAVPAPPAPPAPPAAAAAPAAPAPPARGRSAPEAAFGAYAPPAVGKRSRGIASRQLGPQLVSFAIVAATAVALVLYFADH